MSAADQPQPLYLTAKKFRVCWVDGTYVASDVVREVKAALNAMRSEDYDDACMLIEGAACTAGPGALADRLRCLSDCARAELIDGEEPACDHDYRWELQTIELESV